MSVAALDDILQRRIDSLGREGEPPTLTDADIKELHALVGPMLVPALEMIDHGDVVKLDTPHGLSTHLVHGSSATHTVMLRSPHVPPSCSCPAFVQTAILTQDHVACKHLLAVMLAEKLGRCSPRLATYDFLAAMSTGFTVAPPT